MAITVTVTKSAKRDYDDAELFDVAIDGNVIGTVRKNVTVTPKLAGRIRIGESRRKGWSWALSYATCTAVKVGRYNRTSGMVLSSRVKAVDEMVATYNLFAARV